MKRILFISILLISALSSCQRIETDGGTIHLKAGVGLVMTKGTASDDSGIRDYAYPGELSVALARIDEQDADFPFFKNCSSALQATLGTPDAYYKRDITFPSAQYYKDGVHKVHYASWYPADGVYESTASNTTVTFDIDGATDILYGTIAKGNKTDGFNEIVFNHALCQFNVYAYKMTADDVDFNWGALQNIVVRNVQRQCVLTLPSSGDGMEYSIDYSNDDTFELNLKDAANIGWHPDGVTDIPVGFDQKELVSTYVAAPPKNGYVTLSVQTSTQGASQQVSIARNFQPGCAYDIVLRFSSHGIINAEVSVGEWTCQTLLGGEKITQDASADMFYDLSAYTTSNCYIVPSGNFGYSFTGNVKGNSKEVIPTGYVDVLWCDNADIYDSEKDPEENYFQLESHTLSKNRIMFKVGDIKKTTDKVLEHKGNLVIAAYDHQGGTVLWSWHIWFNDSVNSVGLNNGYLVLNQDLGATGAGTEGLYYQWARKDPFSIGHFSTDTKRASLQESVQNPTTFYGKGQASMWFAGEPAELPALCGWTAENTDLYKSPYDPCPPGYHVGDYRMWSREHIASYETSYIADNSVTLEVGNTPIKFNLSQGYLGADAEKKTDQPLWIWPASMTKDGSNTYAFTYPASGQSDAIVTDHYNYAGALRCVSKTPATVKDLSAVQTANSYIISKDGFYRFRADVAGNGVNTLITDKGDEWDMTGVLWGTGAHVDAEFVPAKVDYLWYQPALDSSIPASINTNDLCLRILNDGKLERRGDHYYANIEVENWAPGNYILAAYDSKGVVLWSWHLWLTEQPSDDSGDFFTLMDRNLGATSKGSAGSTAASALASYGFLYQWGRKDPIVGPSSANASTSTASSSWFEYSNGSWTTRSSVRTIAGPVDVKVAAQNPQSFITNSSGVHWMEGYSTSAENSIKFKCAAIWGYACDGGGWGNKPTKTLYDPCPPGYMVAHHWAFWNQDGSNVNGSKSSGQSDFSASGYVRSWSRYNGLYPLSGWRTRSEGKASNVGTTGYYTESVPNGSVGRHMSIGASWEGLRNNSPDASTDPANAQSVRCLKL